MSREELIQRIIDVLQADDRVRATWLSGSLGRGAGDRYSDVDLVAIVAEENRAGFVAEWDGIVATIASVVLTNRLSFRSSTVFNQVTADWLRFDVSVITPASLDRYTASTVRPLFDKDDLYSRLRQKGEPLAPSGPRIQGLTKEFMRILGLLPVVLGREEYAVSASGSGLIRMLLIQLMTEDVAVEDRGGALHLRGLLPDAQLAAIDELGQGDAQLDKLPRLNLDACDGDETDFHSSLRYELVTVAPATNPGRGSGPGPPERGRTPGRQSVQRLGARARSGYWHTQMALPVHAT